MQRPEAERPGRRRGEKQKDQADAGAVIQAKIG